MERAKEHSAIDECLWVKPGYHAGFPCKLQNGYIDIGPACIERRFAAQQANASGIIFQYIFPNCLAPLLVIVTIQMSHAITLEASLSFLGLGLPITEPSLGLLISNGFRHLMNGRYWISMYPGVALFILVMAINLVADRLRDIFNPRLQR